MTAGAQVGGNRNALNKPVYGSGQRDWSYGLFSCFDECGTCLFSWCCPCFSYGQTQSRYKHLAAQGMPHPTGGELCNNDCLVYGALMFCGMLPLSTRCFCGPSHLSMTGCPCLIAMGGRKHIRERYLIEGSDGSDWYDPGSCEFFSLYLTVDHSFRVASSTVAVFFAHSPRNRAKSRSKSRASFATNTGSVDS